MVKRYLISLISLFIILPLLQAQNKKAQSVRPGNPAWPKVWASYKKEKSNDMVKDFEDLIRHGVGAVSISASDVSTARNALMLARSTGMKFYITFPDITENYDLVRSFGLTPVDALMIGGVYQGKAIDRHVFSFKAGQNEIIIEQPVYDSGYAYREGGFIGGEPMGHYFIGMPEPVRAEIVVPLKKFDGQQHLKIIPATITPASSETNPVKDSFSSDMLKTTKEYINRKLYRLSFDLTGLDNAMLDQVGLAVYWPYRGSDSYWMTKGAMSAAAESTIEALRASVRKTISIWSEANGGSFPDDVVILGSFGGECFYLTSHIESAPNSSILLGNINYKNSPAVNYPLWDFSEPCISSFRNLAGNTGYPRTWGFPEIYGADAYACWLYNLHSICANLAVVIREETSKTAPALLISRMTTRSGALAMSNDFDGTGPELLARKLDVIEIDPYPIGNNGYTAFIPRDMSYYAGLARRYNRPFIPWMQAFTNEMTVGNRHATPELIDSMAGEIMPHSPDAVLWFYYGRGKLGGNVLPSFPEARPDTWERAGGFNKQFAATPPHKPVATVAVLRPYSAWALSSLWDNKVRNPADWLLQQWLEVWAVKYHQPYDVFELSPRMSEKESEAIEKELKKYKYVVSTAPRAGAWIIGDKTVGQAIDIGKADEMQLQFEAELYSRGWLVKKNMNLK